jgi:toxin FitB
MTSVIAKKTFNISILTKIEFLGWDKHTPDGFEKCKLLVEPADIYYINEDIANKAIDLKRGMNIKLADAVIAATAVVHNLKLATRNVGDFKGIEGLRVVNPFE